MNNKSYANGRVNETPVHKYFYIDILRGLAILMVIAVHVGQQIHNLPLFWMGLFNYGQMGVQLFFVASALTLCLSMTERNEKSCVNFYIRRIFRIAPLYYFGIMLFFVWRVVYDYFNHGILHIPEVYNSLGVVENILFIHGFDPRNYNYIVPGGWSIATEMAFYLIFPLIYAAQKKYTIRKFVLISLAVVVLCFLVEYCLIFYVQPVLYQNHLIKREVFNDEFGFIYAFIINQLSVFLVGVISFKCLGCFKVAPFAIILFFIFSLLSFFLLNTTIVTTGVNGFFYPLFSSLSFFILVCWLSRVTWNSRNIIPTIIAKIGRVSFSMYLIHFLFLEILSLFFNRFVFVNLPSSVLQLFIFYITLVILTFFISKISFNKIEIPGISLGNKLIQKLNSNKDTFGAV